MCGKDGTMGRTVLLFAFMLLCFSLILLTPQPLFPHTDRHTQTHIDNYTTNTHAHTRTHTHAPHDHARTSNIHRSIHPSAHALLLYVHLADRRETTAHTDRSVTSQFPRSGTIQHPHPCPPNCT